jgi:hypothetical protein
MAVPAGPSAAGNRSRMSGKGLAILIALLLSVVGGVILVVGLNRGHQAAPDEDERTETVAQAPVLSEHELKAQSAISRGVSYLRNRILNPSTKEYYFNDPGAGSNVGVLALAGLTLLECGVPSADPAVEKVLKTVQDEAPRLRFTYSLALCVLFLDRLNQATDRIPDPNHRQLIQRLAAQLMAAQNGKGGWGYYCPVLTPAEQDKVLGDLAAGQFRPGRFAGSYDDNSINQFATLALWAARRHGIKTDPALALVERRYQQNQNEDGSWGYRARDNGYLKDATTCAGLIGLAVGQGIRADEAAAKRASGAAEPTKEPYIARGLAYVAKAVGKDPRGLSARERDRRRRHTAAMMALNKQWQEAPEHERPLIKQRLDALDDAQRMKGTYFDSDSWGDLYFLWSVERVAVVFDLKTIGGKDWYAWGAEIILANQQQDGSWRDRFPGVPDTCFALLFLKQANIAKDLTDKLRVAARGLSVGAAPGWPGEMPPPPPARKE